MRCVMTLKTMLDIAIGAVKVTDDSVSRKCLVKTSRVF